MIHVLYHMSFCVWSVEFQKQVNLKGTLKGYNSM